MPLFNQRFLKRQIDRESSSIPTEHHALLEAWSNDIKTGHIQTVSEDKIEARFHLQILQGVLGYTTDDGMHDNWNSQPKVQIGSGRVDLALGYFDREKIENVSVPFELKGAKTSDLDAIMSGRNKTPVQQAWEYAVANVGTDWILVCNMTELRLYSYKQGVSEYETWSLEKLTEPEEYSRFRLLLTPKNLLEGYTQQLLEKSQDADKEISEELYADYKRLRSDLIREITHNNPNLFKPDVIRSAQTILDRILFIAFAEDTNLLPADTLKSAFEYEDPYGSENTAWDRFKSLFKFIDEGNEKLDIPKYNGGLFAPNKIIQSLKLSKEVMFDFKKLGDYDFESEVRVTVLGRIFEQSISDIEELYSVINKDETLVDSTSKTSGRRKREAVFYTPDYIAHHIVSETVGRRLSELFEKCVAKYAKTGDVQQYEKIIWRTKKKRPLELEAWEEYRSLISKFKVVDPACGSGVFLVAAFDYLKAEYKRVNSKIQLIRKEENLEYSIDIFDTDTEVLTNNLYGVDVNEESIEITKLSLWLKTARRGKVLDSLDDNLKVGDSLIGNSNVAYHKHEFDWRTAFSDVPLGKFDAVVGNPPYVDSEEMSKSQPLQREQINKNFSYTQGNWDLYIAFIERGVRQLSSGGYMGYITPDKWISKDFGYQSRKELRDNLVSFCEVGRDVFEDALVDSLITIISEMKQSSTIFKKYEGGGAKILSKIATKNLKPENGYDEHFSIYSSVLQKIDSKKEMQLGDILPAENACATSDTYQLKEFIEDLPNVSSFDKSTDYKVSNTGTLSKYVFRWGVSPMRYLKDDYLHPTVNKSAFHKEFGATYVRRSKSPKLILKGLTLLDAALDLDASYIPGKSTIVIPSDDTNELKVMAALVNSKLAFFYTKEKNASSSYNGGVNFTTQMIDQIPVPKNLDRKWLIKQVDLLVSAHNTIFKSTSKMNTTLHASGANSKLGKKLQSWFNMETKEFLREIKKRGVEIKSLMWQPVLQLV